MSAPDSPALAGMSIGTVLELLRPDFPDVTISKIRFLEAEGLVTPQRAASGYRRFTAYDCARLRFILTAQRDHYLPLKVIRAQLDAQPDGELPPFGSLPRRAAPGVGGGVGRPNRAPAPDPIRPRGPVEHPVEPRRSAGALRGGRRPVDGAVEGGVITTGLAASSTSTPSSSCNARGRCRTMAWSRGICALSARRRTGNRT